VKCPRETVEKEQAMLSLSTARLMAALAAVAIAGPAPAANTVCTNGRCISCDGPINCNNDVCTCNGVPVDASAPGSAGTPQGPCGQQETVIHDNGGGTVATTASVAPTVHVSVDSAVCGVAAVSGPARLLGRSVINGAARVSGQSTLTTSTVNGTSTVEDSMLNQSVLNGNAKVSRSQVTNSTLNGASVVTDAAVVNSVLNGKASVIGRTVQNSVLNN
jgi:hypothetical protein